MARIAWILLFFCQSVFCEKCVTYDFENDFGNHFPSNSLLCRGVSRWNRQRYSSSNINSPHIRSTAFISPPHNYGCMSSFHFNITKGGILEVNVFMGPHKVSNDIITIMVRTAEAGVMDNPVEVLHYSSRVPGFVPGWATLRLDLHSMTGSSEGYVAFMGMAATNSVVLVDSFRYIPPDYDGDCLIYEDFTTTDAPTESTTEITETTTIWQSSTDVDLTSMTTVEYTTWTTATNTPDVQVLPCTDCITYNFEKNFENLFVHNTGKCKDMSFWNLQQYNSTDINSIFNESTLLISPTIARPVAPSCVSSFPFNFTNDGFLEVNVYMNPSSQLLDYLSVLVMSVYEDGSEEVVGKLFHSPLVPNFTAGWSALRLRITNKNPFQGYITLMGMTSNSLMIVDSFRYIPSHCDENQCVIYETNSITTFEPTPDYVSTTDSWKITETSITTDPWATAETVTTTDPWATAETITTTDPWATAETVSSTSTDPWTTAETFTTTHPLVTAEMVTTTDPWATAETVTSTTLDPWTTAETVSSTTTDPWLTTETVTSTTTDPWTTAETFTTTHPLVTEETVTTIDPWATAETPTSTTTDPWTTAETVTTTDPWVTAETVITTTTDSWPTAETVSSTTTDPWTTAETFTTTYPLVTEETVTTIDPWATAETPTSTTTDPWTTAETVTTTEPWVTAETVTSTTTDPWATTEVSTTTDPSNIWSTITTTDTSTTHLDQNSYCADCVTYNFENNFHSLFANNSGKCTGMSSLELQRYTSVDVASPHKSSTLFISSPITRPVSPGCVTLFTLAIENDGVLEVNVYMDPSSQELDFISVLVTSVQFDGNESVVGKVLHSPLRPNFIPGWTTLRLRISVPNPSLGYITLIGMTTNSTLIVDSFRYIPPNCDKYRCEIYEILTDTSTTNFPMTQTTITDDSSWYTADPSTTNDPWANTETTTVRDPWATIETSLDPWATTETYLTTSTDPWATVETSIDPWFTTDPPILTTTTEEPITPQYPDLCPDCFTYDFESNFENLFLHDYGKCTGMSPWKFQNYSSVVVEKPHNSSTSFISSLVTRPVSPGCVSSFRFVMTSNGLLEMKVYMDPASELLDYVSVLVMSIQSDGSEAVVGKLIYSPLLPTFVPGWADLKLHISAPAVFQGYITILGITTNSLLMVDSFRFIPANCDADQCTVY